MAVSRALYFGLLMKQRLLRTVTESLSAFMNPVIVAALGPPVLIGLTALCLLVGAVFGAHPLWNEPELTISEAAALNDRGTIRRLIGEGVDPNRRSRVRGGVLKSQELNLTPLEASVGTRTPTTMNFLLMHGALMDDDDRKVLVCLAAKEKAGEILEFMNASDQEAADCERIVTPW